ncbi:hypothetical protein ACLHIM_02830 [Ligilactobacillus sp. LYQ112]|uniref:hypothetical protein n=1 Tax=unclassified Ligilactobacillus TaxID=2767920 RepID=UPI003853BE68
MKNLVKLTDDSLTVVPQGMGHILTLKGKITVPLKCITKATVATGIFSRPLKAFRSPGTSIPGVYYAGTYYQDHRKLFLNVKRTQTPLVIQLHDAEYEQLILGVTDPTALAQQINVAVRQ